MFRGVRKLFGKVELYISYLPPGTKPGDLKMALPSSATININKNQGFITIDETDDSKAVLAQLNKVYLGGTKLRAKMSFNNSNFIQPKGRVGFQVKEEKGLKQESFGYRNEKKQGQQKIEDRNDGERPKFSLNLEDLKNKLENRSYSRLEKPKGPEYDAKKVVNSQFQEEQISPQQKYLKAISKLKDPFEFNEDYPYREDFALGPRLQERGFK